jgi:anti-sigma factor (TIGR02949 family)
MNCTETRSRLHAYLDRELDLEGALAVERHLAACGDCRAAFESQSALRTGIRRHARYHPAPAGLAARVRAELERQSTGPARRGWPLRWPRLGQWLPLGAAVAATAVLSWTAALQYASGPSDERLAEQVIAGHARAVLTAHRVDVASSDRHTVKPWLSSKLDFSPAVVDLANAGFPLDGGRLDYLDGRPVATLCYRRAQHTIDLFIWPQAKSGGDAPLRTFAAKGYNVARWREAGMAYWAVSDVNDADLRAFVEAYAAAK